jgi:two-component system, chemotaxis family, CheB/CheR fusion protein
LRPAGWKSLPARYGGAVVCVAAATILRMLVNPFLGSRNPYSAAFLALLVAARYLGTGPSIVVGAAGGVIANYMFAGQGRHFQMDGLVLGFYVIASIVAIWLLEVQRRERVKAEENARLASERLTELQQAIAARDSQQALTAKLHAIVESSEDAIISKGLDGVIQSWNYAAERIFGYTSEEMVGRTMRPLLPPDRVQEESGIIERIRYGGNVKHFETVRVRKDGKHITVSLTISPIYDEAGKVVGASHIARDITEQKHMEEQMSQTQKLESLGVLAGGLAHDFNNLLTGIMGNASLSMEDLENPVSLREHIGEILMSSERAALLVRQMLAYAGKGRYLIEPIDVSQQITEIVALIRTSIPRSVQLVLQLDSDPPRVDADRSQLHQLIMNLAINAAEAIGEQPGTVTITTSHTRINDEGQVVLTITDTGCGMDEATKSQMFDPFFTTKFTGRGLGLAAVMGIIRTHRGSISVDSAPGKGTTVAVVLPASTAVTPAAAAVEPVDLRGSGHILVVDDEDLVRNLAKFTLERYGYTTEVASNGEEGLNIFSARPGEFAAVILDLTMPVMGGEEILTHVRRIRPDVPVVLSSGFSEIDALRRFHDRGLAGFLQKPYTATALARKLKQALRVANVPNAK